MKTSFRTHTILFILTVIIAVFIYSCGDDEVTNTPPPVTFNCFTDTNTPAAGIINGTITFFDTNRVYTNSGYYDVSAYTSWPPSGPPSANDSIDLNKVNDIYKGCYQLTNLPPSGTFYIVAAFIKLPYLPGSVFVSAVYGCDTNTACFSAPPPAGPQTVTLPGTEGRANINFNADLDTAKMQIRF